jgi:hypothetical protein
MKILETTPRWLTRTLLAIAVLGLAGVSGWFSPIVTASLWRVFHPRGWVDYRGLYVHVPWPWIADTEGAQDEEMATPQGLGLRRMPQTMIHRLPPQSIFVTVISPDPGLTAEQQTDQWMKMFRQTHAGVGFAETTPVAIPEGASCLRAISQSTPRDVVWTCISVSGGWVANLEGRRSDESVFFEVIGGLRRGRD